jgi:hypothetical protein
MLRIVIDMISRLGMLAPPGGPEHFSSKVQTIGKCVVSVTDG